MNLHEFYYELPKELIAQDPLEDRTASRLLVLDKNTGQMEHDYFRNILSYLKPGDCLVINNTKVIPARLIGLRIIRGQRLNCSYLQGWIMIGGSFSKTREKARPGDVIVFGNGELKAEVEEIIDDGKRIVHLIYIGYFRRGT